MGLDPKSTALGMAIARLYYADQDGKFVFMKLAGILCLVADRRLHSKYFRLYDINTSELLFQAELYINFQQTYKELNDYFFCFPLEKIIIGIQFANVHDASVFRKLVNDYSFKGDSVEDLVKENSTKLGNPNYDISKPISFERKEHAGWDPSSQTFILNEIPKEIKTLLKKAGYKKKDLRTKETALALYELLLREIEFDSLNSSKGNLNQLTAGRTSSNMNLITQMNRISGRPMTTNEDSRILGGPGDNRAQSVNFAGMQTTNTLAMQNMMTNPNDLTGTDKKSQQLMNNLGSYVLNQGKINEFASPGQNPSSVMEEVNGGKKPPIPPPLGGIPPPMGIPPPIVGPGGFMPPPPPGMNILPPPNSSKVAAPALSFHEQLAMQSQNLKKVQNEQIINNKLKNLSQNQQMTLTANLALVLEKRKIALGNIDKNNSFQDSDDDDADSDGSAWE